MDVLHNTIGYTESTSCRVAVIVPREAQLGQVANVQSKEPTRGITAEKVSWTTLNKQSSKRASNNGTTRVLNRSGLIRHTMYVGCEHFLRLYCTFPHGRLLLMSKRNPTQVRLVSI